MYSLFWFTLICKNSDKWTDKQTNIRGTYAMDSSRGHKTVTYKHTYGQTDIQTSLGSITGQLQVGPMLYTLYIDINLRVYTLH